MVDTENGKNTENVAFLAVLANKKEHGHVTILSPLQMVTNVMFLVLLKKQESATPRKIVQVSIFCLTYVHKVENSGFVIGYPRILKLQYLRFYAP